MVSIPMLLWENKYQHLGVWILCQPPDVHLSDPRSWLLITQTCISQVPNLRQNLAELWKGAEKKPFEQKFQSSENDIYRIPGLFPITWNWPLSSLSWHPHLEDHLPNWLRIVWHVQKEYFELTTIKNTAGLSAIHTDGEGKFGFIAARKKKKESGLKEPEPWRKNMNNAFQIVLRPWQLIKWYWGG